MLKTITIRPAITDGYGRGYIKTESGIVEAPEGATMLIINKMRDWVLTRIHINNSMRS